MTDDEVWWDDQPSSPPKEEPDCGKCSDSGHVQRRVGQGWRRCPECNPGRWDLCVAVVQSWRYRVRRWLAFGRVDRSPPF